MRACVGASVSAGALQPNMRRESNDNVALAYKLRVFDNAFGYALTRILVSGVMR